ncbi:MAG TPA: HlyD family efflux transporter periplasmic adaptor subunit [Acidimicrobiales bacterium]|jgi:hypothetical protein|nr:HlyD family efflux transporter periplasmic adaptor subunit [Acidimicrobiales bacterium]
MITTPSHLSTEQDPDEPPSIGRGHRRRRMTVGGVVAVFAAVAVLAAVDPFSNGSPTRNMATGKADASSLATVTRQDLSAQTKVTATLGYAGTYSVVNQAQGTVTAVPTVGQVVSQGDVLYQVSGSPVVLLYGTTPAYRSLSEGTTGADVEELNADLLTLGYVTGAEVSPTSDAFTWWTKNGVEKLQTALGVAETGTLGLGQAVFEPAGLRVTSLSAALGGPVQAGQPAMAATSTTRQVSIALDAAEQSDVTVGDKVTISLPNNQTTPGVISSVGSVATAPASDSATSTPTVTVLVDPTDPAATGSWDQAPVNVTITTAAAHNTLVVPVDALLAQAGGGYSVEVVGADGMHHRVPVTLGLFDDAEGLVQVTGTRLDAGQRVVVPST